MASPRLSSNVATPLPVPKAFDREITIRPNPSLEDKTSSQAVDAINAALAARRMRSGDWRVVLNSKQVAQKFVDDEKWLPQAFGDHAQVVRRTWQVVASGFRLDHVKEVGLENVAAQITDQNKGVTCVKSAIRKDRSRRYISPFTPRTRSSVCDLGLFWNKDTSRAHPSSRRCSPTVLSLLRLWS